MRTAHRFALFVLVLAGAGPAGCGSGSRSAPPPAGPVSAFQTGSAELVVDVPRSGCLVEDAILVTETGVRLVVAAGTCLRTQEGTALQGPVLLRIDDGGPDVDWLAAEMGETLDGTIRVGGALLVDGAEPVLVNVVFDPPATVDLTGAVDPDLEGSWRLQPFFVRGLDAEDEPPPPVIAQVGGEPPSGIRWKPFGASVGARDAPGGSEIITYGVPISTLTGARLNDPTIPAPDATFDGDVIFERNLGPVGSTYPRLCCINLANAGASLAVNQGCWDPGLFLPGQSRVLGIPGDPDQFLIQIVEVDGQRVLRVSSPYKNAFRIHLRYCDGPEPGDFHDESEDATGSEDEADRGGPYLGEIVVRITGCGGFSAARDAGRAVQDVTGGWLRCAREQLVTRQGGAFLLSLLVTGWTTSVRDLADALPPGWTFTPGNRRLEIHVPWPPPMIITSSYAANVLHVIDPDTLQVVRTSDALAGPPDDAVLAFDGTAFVGTQAVGVPVPVPGSISIVDMATGALLDTVPVPALVSGLGIHPLDTEVYGATGLGEFFAYDRAAGAVGWSVQGLVAGQRFSDVSVAPDGAFAFVGSQGGKVYEIDLLRRTLSRSWDLPSATGVAVNAAGTRLAVVDGQVGGVQILDLVQPMVPIVVPGPISTFSPVFAPDSDLLLLAHFADGQVRVVDVALGGAVDTASGAGTLCITSFLLESASHPLLIATNFDDETLSIGELSDPTTPLVLTPVATEPGPNLVRTPGQ